MNPIESLNWRYATKFFDTEKRVSNDDLKKIKQALILSPSSFGLQPWKFQIIEDKELREQLKPHSWDQPQITDCSHLIVICNKTEVDKEYIQKFLEDIVKTRNVDLESLEGYKNKMIGYLIDGDKDVFTWAKNQTYIALGTVMTVCAQLGIDTCPMEGFIPAEYNKILGLTEKGLNASLLCPIGYRSEEDKYANLPKVRFNEEDLFID